MSVRSRIAALPALFAATVLAAGCGTTDDPTSASSTGANASAPITVTDSRGKEVTLDAPAQRVVTLEWNTTEDVITLGAQPVGVADVKGYTSWVSASPIQGEPVDVGTRTEPSVESVADADPDLILGIGESIPGNAMEQMERIAPVVLLTGADADAPLETMRENFETIGRLIGKEDRAKEVLAQLDQKIEDGRTAIEGAGKTGTPLAFTYIWAEGNGFSVRMHGPRSQPAALASTIDVEPAWTKPGDEEWGLSTTDLEGLTQLPADTVFAYWGNDDEKPPVDSLNANSLWKSLPFVKAGNVHEAANGVWIYGGPASSMQWLDNVVEIVTQ